MTRSDSPGPGVHLAVAGHLATVTLDRPARRNAVDGAMVDALLAHLDAIEAERGVRVVLFRGRGPAFCAGMDLRRYAPTPEAARDPEVEVVGLLRRIERLRPPTIAVVHGAAYAGGCLLALHCDLRIASTAASFAMPLSRIGLVVPFPMVQKLVDELGPSLARQLLLTGEPIDGAAAARAGLVHRLVAPEELDEATAELARTVAARAPRAVQTMKAMVHRALSLREGVPHADLTAEALAIRDSDDAREGLAALAERRPPAFRGR